ncbi:MAG: hypothetical protein F083_2955 [bacterium F083]|nr:MAG: hypothetical protein F083_2955 [bacterium F083]
MLVEFDEHLVNALGKRLVVCEMLFDFFGEKLFPVSPKKLFEIKGIHINFIDLSDGERVLLAIDGHPKQASGGHNVILRRILAKDFQRHQSPLAALDFIKDD